MLSSGSIVCGLSHRPVLHPTRSRYATRAPRPVFTVDLDQLVQEEAPAPLADGLVAKEQVAEPTSALLPVELPPGLEIKPLEFAVVPELFAPPGDVTADVVELIVGTPIPADPTAAAAAALAQPLEFVPLTDATESPTTPATPSIVELLPVAPVPVVDLPAIPTSPAPLPTADDAPAPTPGLPRLSELMRFCLPTLGIWLSAPMLSLIDTSMVGIACSPIELAALGPSTKVCDYLAFFFTFLGAATTNLAADAFARKQPEQAQRVVGGTLSISLALGAALAVGLSAAAAPLMASMLGSATHASVGGATQYTAIRALGYPAALATMVLQVRAAAAAHAAPVP